MGSRAAAALARQLSEEAEDAVQGLVCLSFPLHPPAQTRAHLQRSEDLRELPKHTSVLFVSGTDDNMCDRVRMSKHIVLYVCSLDRLEMVEERRMTDNVLSLCSSLFSDRLYT